MLDAMSSVRTLGLPAVRDQAGEAEPGGPVALCCTPLARAPLSAGEAEQLAAVLTPAGNGAA
jgi:hypothetical protein